MTLIRFEFILDFRDRFSVASVVLYAVVTVFLCLIALQEPDREVWNILYWVLFSFAAIISAINCFTREAYDHRLFYYQLTTPESIFLSKWLAQFAIQLTIGVVLYGSMAALSYNPVENYGLFGLAVVVSALCVSAILTFASALSSLSSGPAVLLSIMSFPLLIPVLLLSQYTSGVAVGIFDQAQYWQYMSYLVAIFLLSFSAGIFLINFVWRN